MAVCKNNKILIVDDEPLNRLFLVDLLKMHNLTPIQAINGREAIQHWLANDFFAILMDIQMPEMNGLDATRFIRQQEEGRPKTPIIAITAYGTKASQADCEQAGMNGYLTKPLSISTLLETIAPFYASPLSMIFP
ncbi:MAG: response regulator [Desulfurivibrionaceae bacterium]|nr:response regulator [Desulfurivibrionaceae bacterium]